MASIITAIYCIGSFLVGKCWKAAVAAEPWRERERERTTKQAIKAIEWQEGNGGSRRKEKRKKQQQNSKMSKGKKAHRMTEI